MKTILAALLHDVGKFYQRTGMKVIFDDTDKSYIKYNRNNKSYSHFHAAYTSKFIGDVLSRSLPEFSEFIKMASSHHIDDSSIRKADIIAAGHDRDRPYELDELEASEDEEFRKDTYSESKSDRYAYITTRMNSIFDEIYFDKERRDNKVRLKSSSNYSITSNNYILDRENGCNEYKELFKEFLEKVKQINNYTSYEEFHHYIYPLIKEYMVSIPAATYMQKNTTVSLFEHLKLTAAVAGCLEKGEGDNQFVLVDYDLSGIQKFIYQVTEGESTKKNIAKMLRSRSFYLNIITDFLAYYIVDQFGLSYENILYSSGGRGRILLPYSKNIKNKLKEINLNIEKALYERHQMGLAFMISYNVVSDNELRLSSFSDLIGYENKEFISRKNQKFKSLIEKEFCFVNPPIQSVCKYCETNESQEGNICEICKNLLKLNEFLVKNESFIIEFDYSSDYKPSAYAIEISGIGKIIFHENTNMIVTAKGNYFITVNNYKCKNWIGELKYYAMSEHDGKTFEDIAKQSTGDKKLAVIKMDVDNLGYIFANGIKKDRNTISKNLTLSRMIDYFFTKQLVSICNQEKYKKSIYINYSGGDDLVIIAPASMSIALASDIITSFKEFTGRNSNITISAGIEIFHPSSPVRFAILRAEQQLEKSKHREEKNATSVLNCSVSNEKLKQVEVEIEKYVNKLNNDELSTTCLYDIYTAILLSLQHCETEDAFKKYIPQIAYTIKRNLDSKLSLFNEFKEIFITRNITKEKLEYYKIVFGYALMSTRTKHKGGK